MAAPSFDIRSASHGGTRPPCSGRSATPERFIGRLRRASGAARAFLGCRFPAGLFFRRGFPLHVFLAGGDAKDTILKFDVHGTHIDGLREMDGTENGGRFEITNVNNPGIGIMMVTELA